MRRRKPLPSKESFIRLPRIHELVTRKKRKIKESENLYLRAYISIGQTWKRKELKKEQSSPLKKKKKLTRGKKRQMGGKRRNFWLEIGLWFTRWPLVALTSREMPWLARWSAAAEVNIWSGIFSSPEKSCAVGPAVKQRPPKKRPDGVLSLAWYFFCLLLPCRCVAMYI